MDHGLERYITTLARADARISLIKIPEPVKILKRQGSQISGILTRRIACDFVGWLAGGQAIYIEAKATTSKRRWHLDKRMQGHQVAWLASAAKMGTLASVMVRHCNGHQCLDYLVPVAHDGLPFDGVSVMWADLAPYKIDPGKTFVDLLISNQGGKK